MAREACFDVAVASVIFHTQYYAFQAVSTLNCEGNLPEVLTTLTYLYSLPNTSVPRFGTCLTLTLETQVWAKYLTL